MSVSSKGIQNALMDQDKLGRGPVNWVLQDEEETAWGREVGGKCERSQCNTLRGGKLKRKRWALPQPFPEYYPSSL